MCVGELVWLGGRGRVKSVLERAGAMAVVGNPRNITTMLPTSSAAVASSSSSTRSGSSGRQPSSSLIRSGRLLLLPVVCLLLLFLPADVRGDYENTWNSYYEQPCCGGTANGPFHLRHHGDHVREFQCGKFYYRTFYMDEERDALYVGAMNRVYKLNLKNISMTSCEKDSMLLDPTGTDIRNCVSRGKSEMFDCKNHIRVIQPMDNGTRLYICGTNAHSPKDIVIFRNLTHLPRSEYVPGVGLGVAKCPYDPIDNSTAIFVHEGNPGDLPALYSGTNAEFTKADTVIFRADLYEMSTGKKMYNFKRTLKYDSKWLDKPNFVGSFDIGEYVYFFFREIAVEYINCGKAVYSRVARVCKKDTGGKNILNQNWATYLKARLNCSISGEFPFYFNEIQDVYQMPSDKTKFYATFTTSTNGLVGSAVCSFSLGEIHSSFAGKFKEQATSNSAWLPVMSSKIPEPRPGTCVEDTTALPDAVLNFIRSHPLMDRAISHDYGNPVFYKRDLILTKLVVDKISIDILNQEYLVYYLATNEGRIYKVVQFFHDGQSRAKLLDIFDVAPNEPIQVMRLSQRYKSLYIGTDSRIKQIDLVMCNRRYDSCYRCVQDPYCGWDRDSASCRPYQLGFLQDVGNRTSDICDTNVMRKKIIVTFGQSVHLGCFARVPEILKYQPVTWYHHSKERGRYEVRYSVTKHIETSEGGLVVIAINESDGGRYDCYLGGSLLCSFSLIVDAHRCTAPSKGNDYQKIYSDWCHEFERYKSALKRWEAKQSQCSTNPKDNELDVYQSDSNV